MRYCSAYRSKANWSVQPLRTILPIGHNAAALYGKMEYRECGPEEPVLRLGIDVRR